MNIEVDEQGMVIIIEALKHSDPLGIYVKDLVKSLIVQAEKEKKKLEVELRETKKQ